MRRILEWLERSFFRPGDLRDLAIVRIVLAGAYLVLLHPPLGEQLRLAREGAASEFLPLPALKVLLLPLGTWGMRPDPELVHGVWIVSMLAAALVLIGLWTKPAALAWASTYTILVAHGYSFGEFHHPEGLYAIALWILAFSTSGAALSLDRIRFRTKAAGEMGVFRSTFPDERESPEATWPLRAIQWTMAIAYCSAGLFKVVRSGLTWLNGHTLSFYLIQDAVRWDRPLGLPVAGFEPATVALSVVTLLFELTFPIAVVIPAASLLYIPVGVAMHGGMWFLMRAIFPHWMVLYVAFLPSLRHGWRRVRSGSPAPARNRVERTVVYDGACRLCLRTMAVLDELDLGSRLRYLDGREGAGSLPPELRDDAILHVMHVLETDGTVRRGFDGFRSLARVVRPLWPILPLLHLPGAGALGRRVYAVVANRRRLCAAGRCGVGDRSGGAAGTGDRRARDG